MHVRVDTPKEPGRDTRSRETLLEKEAVHRVPADPDGRGILANLCRHG